MKLLKNMFLAASAAVAIASTAANASVIIVESGTNADGSDLGFQLIDSTNGMTAASNTIWFNNLSRYFAPDVRLLSVTLRVVAEDIDIGENVGVAFNGTTLGYLTEQSFSSDDGISSVDGSVLNAADELLLGVLGGRAGKSESTVTDFAIDISTINSTDSTFANIGVAFESMPGYWAEIEKASMIVEVPEPLTLALIGVGLAGFGMSRRKKQS